MQVGRLLPASLYILEYRRISENISLFALQQPLYLLRFSLIFLDVACGEAAKTASRKAPTRFAVYLRKSENI